jgi:two-component system, chemotaxis family, protein-glutamate methylesterase/glutaminase
VAADVRTPARDPRRILLADRIAERQALAVRVLTMGGSLGAFEAASRMLARLAAGAHGAPWAGVLALHATRRQSGLVAGLIASQTGLRVREANDGETVSPGEILVARPDRHLMILPGGRIALDDGPPRRFHRPSIDNLFESAARELNERVVAVLLSGADADGVEGLIEVAARGGMIGVQHPDSASAPTMPAAALAACMPNCVAPPRELGDWLAAVLRLPEPPDSSFVLPRIGPGANGLGRP